MTAFQSPLAAKVAQQPIKVPGIKLSQACFACTHISVATMPIATNPSISRLAISDIFIMAIHQKTPLKLVIMLNERPLSPSFGAAKTVVHPRNPAQVSKSRETETHPQSADKIPVVMAMDTNKDILKYQ